MPKVYPEYRTAAFMEKLILLCLLMALIGCSARPFAYAAAMEIAAPALSRASF